MHLNICINIYVVRTEVNNFNNYIIVVYYIILLINIYVRMHNIHTYINTIVNISNIYL